MEDKIIQVLRNESVKSSRTDAISWLNTEVSHKKGQPVLVTYYSEENDLDCIFAIGIEDGIGAGYYKIISISSEVILSGIATSDEEIPDVTSLISGKKWIYKNPADDSLYWVYLDNKERRIEEVDSNIYYRAVLDTTGAEYKIYNNEIENITDIYSKSQIDEKFSNIKTEYTSITTDLSKEIIKVKGNLLLGTGLGANGAYNDGIEGASSLMEADQILLEMITKSTLNLSDILNRLKKIEEELYGTEGGGMDDPTRLDETFEYIDDEKHVPTFSVKFSRKDSDPLIAGSTHSYWATYEWSWAARGTATGLKLDDTVKEFDSETGEADVNYGTYTWEFEYTFPIKEQSQTKTWYGYFEGLEVDKYLEEPVEFSQTTLPIQRTITITSPEEKWISADNTVSATVEFNATGFPKYYKGEQLLTFVDNDPKSVFATTTSDTQTYTDTIDVVPALNSKVSILATWNDKDTGEEKIVKSKTIIPSFYSISSREISEDDFTTDDITSPYACYLESRETVIPSTEYEAGSSLIYLTQYPLTGVTVVGKTGSQDPFTVTDFIASSKTIKYNGVDYYYLIFSDIGSGTYKFTIS